MGAVVIVVLPLLAMFIREYPGPNDKETDAPTPSAEAVQAAEPLKALSILAMPQFWGIGLAIAITLSQTSTIMVTLAPLAEGIGAGATQAASLITVLSIAGFVGGLIVAVIGDKIDRMLLITAMIVLTGAVAVLFYFSASFTMYAVSATVLGIAAGAINPAFAALVADRFGAASFGTTYGMMNAITTVVAAASARFAGEVFDRTGSYGALFLTIAAIEVIAVALMLGTRMWAKPVAGAGAGGGAPALH
jgi:cyanate permease